MMRRIKTLFAGGVLALALFGAAIAGPSEDASAAYQRGDYETALRLWRSAAGGGDAAAQDGLGLLYLTGNGVPQDYEQALMWLHKGAEQGNVDAQVGLAECYNTGLGVPQNYVLAYMWANLAASRAANSEARTQAFNDRDTAAAIMTPAQIAAAQKMAREWKPK